MSTTALPAIDFELAVDGARFDRGLVEPGLSELGLSELGHVLPAVAATPVPLADRLERWVTLIVPFGLFCWIGWRLAVDLANLPGDSLSRMLNASSAVLSRDPHLEAIGFVWSPFPSLWQVPLVNLARLWPVLVDRGVIAVAVSAFLMTWTTSAVRRWLVDIGVQRWTRFALVLAFVLHPFILLFGANGMSEAGMLCFSVLAARRVALWFETERPIELARAGVVLGFGYLTRYEVAATIVALVALVAVVTYRRTSGENRRPAREAALTASVIAFPALFAVFLWALVSWAIVGAPFAQFTSRYGNSQLVRAGASGIIRATGAVDGVPRVIFFVKQLVAFGAVSAVALALLTWWGTRGGLRIWTAILALGAPLGFQLAAAYAGSSFVWGRYVISIVPLTTMLLGAAAVNLAAVAGGRHRITGLFVGSLAIGSMLIGLGLIRGGQFETGDERSELAAVPVPYGTGAVSTRDTVALVGARIAAEIDLLQPRRGEVLTDTASSIAGAVVLNSEDQRDYVVTSDRDFERANADPGIFGVRYLLVPDSQAAGVFNALNAERPTLFETGAGIATLVKEWPSGSRTDGLRLYELNRDQRIGGT